MRVIAKSTLVDFYNRNPQSKVAVEEYENVHYPIGTPSLVDVIKLRMYERNLTTDGLADLLGMAKGTLSEMFAGNYEPTINQGRVISQRLSIDPAVVLGV